MQKKTISEKNHGDFFSALKNDLWMKIFLELDPLEGLSSK